jgi:hypothetical protein
VIIFRILAATNRHKLDGMGIFHSAHFFIYLFSSHKKIIDIFSMSCTNCSEQLHVACETQFGHVYHICRQISMHFLQAKAVPPPHQQKTGWPILMPWYCQKIIWVGPYILGTTKGSAIWVFPYIIGTIQGSAVWVFPYILGTI